MITYEPDQLKKSNRKNINTARRKGRTAKIYTMNIERKRLLKQRRENTLQNAKGKRPTEEYFLTALKASHKTYKALKSKQKRKKNDNGLINNENTNIAMIANNINNLKIVTNNDVNTITNAKNADIEPTDIDNINTADIDNDKADMDNDKSKDTIMSNYNDDNSAMSDNDSPQTISGNDAAEDSDLGENSTEDTPSPLFYGRKTKDPTKVKTSKQHRPIKITPLESPMGNPHVDKDATGKSNAYVFDPTDVQIREFFFEGEPNPKDLEGVEEDKTLEIHRTFQQKLKERDVE